MSQTIAYRCFNSCRILQNIESNRSKESGRTSASKEHRPEFGEVETLESL